MNIVPHVIDGQGPSPFSNRQLVLIVKMISTFFDRVPLSSDQVQMVAKMIAAGIETSVKELTGFLNRQDNRLNEMTEEIYQLRLRIEELEK